MLSSFDVTGAFTSDYLGSRVTICDETLPATKPLGVQLG
jgi:hypothetical protein